VLQEVTTTEIGKLLYRQVEYSWYDVRTGQWQLPELWEIQLDPEDTAPLVQHNIESVHLNIPAQPCKHKMSHFNDNRIFHENVHDTYSDEIVFKFLVKFPILLPNSVPNSGRNGQC